MKDFDAARQVHQAILQHANDPERVDGMLLMSTLSSVPDVVAVALLRGTFSFRPALKHWNRARDVIRDRMMAEGKNVDLIMRGLL